MASVFLSYARVDAAKAKSIALALEKAGHDVWWDRQIKGGAQYSKEIEEALKRADAVIVLWSAYSIESAWVRDEAAAGRDRVRLIPVCLDDANPPLGFRQYQNIDLSNWKGRGEPPGMHEILTAIDSLAGQQPGQRGAPVIAPTIQERSRTVRVAIIMALVLSAIAAAYFLAQPGGRRDVVTISVAAAEPAAEPLVRDLLVKLGTLQSAKSGSMQLVSGDGNGGRPADMVFQIAGEMRVQKPAASLVLMTGEDRAILWSGDFEQDSGNLADLKQQVAFSAARVLGCALEGLSPRKAPLSQSVLKLYLNACALLGNTFMTNSGDAIPMLEKVTQQAPSFEPGWAKLLLAATDRYIDMTPTEQRIAAAGLRRRISAARKINPVMPESYIAEIELLQGPAFLQQLKLLDLAAQSDPENAFVLSTRSLVNLGVGRMEDAVNDSRRAVDLDPLSPAMRNAYIGALTYAGRFDTAKAELLNAERLWPGASTVLDAKARLLLPYGDPAEALLLYRSGELRSSRARLAFLEARLNRTPENIDRAVKLAISDYRNDPARISGLFHALAEFKRTDELFEILIAWRDRAQIPYFVEILFRPQLASFRTEPRFMLVAARLGILDYWRQSGRWPDFCSDPDLPYDCKAEAAKLS